MGNREFGGGVWDGTHPTTAGVMAALQAIDPAQFQPRSACDMGCGSGILTVAVAAVFGCPVLAVDISAAALDMVQANAARNGCAPLVRTLHADGFSHPAMAAASPFDLIVMNILAEPLMGLAVAASQALAADGILVLSGMLAWQEPLICEAYQYLGLELTSRLTVGDWVTLVMQKPWV